MEAIALLVRWRKPLAILATLAALVAGYYWWEGKVEARGYARANAEWVAKEEAITKEAEARYKVDLAKALLDQKEVMQEDNRLALAAAKWEKTHEDAVQKHTAALLSGVERLRIDVRPAADPVPGAAEGGAGAAAGAPVEAEAADVVPEVAAAILRIAADSARNVYDFNDLLARYRLMEKKVCR